VKLFFRESQKIKERRLTRDEAGDKKFSGHKGGIK
jgi:hypothetical protein